MALGLPTALGAQGFQLSGHVFSVIASDTVPLDHHWVMLHQVDATGGRVVDSVRTGVAGMYFLRAPERDTAAVYLSSVSFRGIGYFSNPVGSAIFTSDTASTLFVYDTSSVGPPVQVVERTVVVRAPEADGSRSALEILLLENPGQATRIANDTANPVWQGAIPSGAFNLEVAPGDISPTSLYRRGDSVAVAAAVPPGPGNRKRIVFGYILPKGLRDLTVPVDQPLGRLQILIEDPLVEMVGGPLSLQAPEFMNDIQFMRFDGTDIPSGAHASFRLSGPSASLAVLLWVILAMSGMAMTAVLAVWIRRPRVAAGHPSDMEVLAARVAALDERVAARGAQLSDDARAAFDRERSALKTELTEALARRDAER